jgi:predicted secreted acid phosphatase
MKKSYLIVFISILFYMFGVAYAAEPANIGLLRLEVAKYHDSGTYGCDFDKVVAHAQQYLAKRVKENIVAKKKLAIVFDIDETIMNEYKHWAELGFGGTRDQINAAIDAGDGEAIPSALNLYNFAKAHNVAVFIITGRNEPSRQVTISNLNKAGFKDWDGLYLRPLSDKEKNPKSVIPFKSSMRKQIVDQGYDIVVNIGDQNSDLAGGYADKQFKLPDPFYYVP